MTWTVNTTERFGGVNRAPRINPYIPARTEKIGTNAGQASYLDIGKPVKLSGDTVVLCASGDEIYGFIESVEAGTNQGFSIGGVLCDPGLEALATDEVGDLAVGDLVVAGTAVAFGAANPTTGANVIGYVPTVDSNGVNSVLAHRWQVLAYYGVQGRGRQVMVRKV